jgi:tryptophanyl-tRNA synthetase
MKPTPRIFTGMQPTGKLQASNNLGALCHWSAPAPKQAYSAMVCIVDSHPVTIDYSPKYLPGPIFAIALTYLAAGIDPNSILLFAQRDVPQHTELSWPLETVTPLGDLTA